MVAAEMWDRVPEAQKAIKKHTFSNKEYNN